MDALVDADEGEQVLTGFLRDIAGLAADELDEVRSAPMWRDMVRAAHVLPRELRAIADYEFDAARFADLTTSTLMLTGSESPLLYGDAAEAVDDALPNSRIVTLDGQQHMAMHTAPDRFVDEVLAFVTCPPRPDHRQTHLE